MVGGTFCEIAVSGAGIWLVGGTFCEIAVSGTGIWLVGGTFCEIAVSGAGIWLVGGEQVGLFSSIGGTMIANEWFSSNNSGSNPGNQPLTESCNRLLY
ncbi:hypothetical protein [Cohnella luojiensis]|uniref:Uncharacterized protein n=1 Tax=Cohnella luojiensis TaxID=652876 RepID=A0A4Y8M4S9_9BACL|nr:hypothetical protein [Cohnella luojiensis]TFE29477.1 hypothetical protein E2980_05640 [Cohnella luojiensis]